MDSTHVSGLAGVMKKKLLFIINDPNYFISHRLPIAIAAREQGYEIHVATGEPTILAKIREESFAYHFIPLSRSGRNIFSETKSIIAIYHLMRRVKPSIVHLVTIKPVIYGSLAARFAKVPAVVAAITGLGYAFIDHHAEAQILRKIVVQLYRLAFRHQNLKVLFQNEDDKNKLISFGALKEEQSVLIRGSGVDLTQYTYSSEPESPPFVVVLASRLLKDKGVVEYVEAAKLLKKWGLNARFLLAGYPDPGNPSSISEAQIKEWTHSQDIEYVGYQNTASLFPHVHLVVLPSYREGLPRVLVEAAACGRAIITTDVPGCRAAIIRDKTGLLVKARDPVSLAEAIRSLLVNARLRNTMGAEGRKLAESEFDIKKIVEQHLQVYHMTQDRLIANPISTT